MSDGDGDDPPARSADDGLRREVFREGTTMALYISLSLLAVQVALPSGTASDGSLWWLILVTSVGLLIAHQLAFRMSSRLVSDGSVLGENAPALLRAQLIGGFAVTALAVLPVLILGPGALWLSTLLLVAFVMVVGYLVARSAPASRLRSLGYAGVVALLVMAVLFVKSLAGH